MRAEQTNATNQAGARVVVMALICFVLGSIVSFVWFNHAAKRIAQNAGSETTVTLSASTIAILDGLDSPLDIRFYSLLNPATVSESVPPFAERVDDLLSKYEQAANGKIKVARFKTPSDSAANAASADGIKPFNLDKGDACFFGLAVARGDRKESLPQLTADWEPALESDLSHAIVRVSAAKPATKAPVQAPRLDAAAAREVRSIIPDPAAVSADDGARILREAALKEFQAAAEEMDNQVREAQQRLAQAQNSGSDTEQQAAMKYLQEVQARQSEKLKQIASRSKAQIEAWAQMKPK